MTLVCTDSCVLVCVSAASTWKRTAKETNAFERFCAACFQGDSAFRRGLEIIFQHALLRILTIVFILLVARRDSLFYLQHKKLLFFLCFLLDHLMAGANELRKQILN